MERHLKLSFTAQAYDQHLNMILGEVEETVTTVEIDEETYEELYKVSVKVMGSNSLRSVSKVVTERNCEVSNVSVKVTARRSSRSVLKRLDSRR